MTKTFKIYGIYLLLQVFGSCITYHETINDVDFSGATHGENHDNDYRWTDTFTKDIIFIVSYYTGNLSAMNTNFSNKCYGQFDPGTEIDNHIDKSSLSIK